MAIEVIARGKIHAGKKSGNNFRFQPGRTQGIGKTANQTLFRSLTYVRGTIAGTDDGSFKYGAVMGPNQVVSGSGNHAILDPNSKVIPVVASNDTQLVPIRKFYTPEELKKPHHQRVAKTFIDWASFQSQQNGEASLVKYLGNNTVNVEIWTGLFEKMTEEMYQLIFGLEHGSINYSGSKTVARAKKKLVVDETAPEGEAIVEAKAKFSANLVLEDHATVVNNNDVPLWSVRTWEIEYSPGDSAIVLVRHFDAFYVVEVKKGEELVITKYTDKDAAVWKRRFLKDWSAALAAERTKAEIDAKLASAA
jgi:hypothetical protein